MPPEKRQPEVGDTWAYKGTRWKDSQITITAVRAFEVCYTHERQATTKLRLFHKRFKFVCSKAEYDKRLREGIARADAKRLAAAKKRFLATDFDR
jgi:hypothetical protein